MMGLLKKLELLRPLAESKAWEYCIVWKISDNPSRCIEWVGCCCSGSQGVCENVKEEIDGVELRDPYLCKDTYIEHSLRTNACKRLAIIPCSVPLYPGIHGEVEMSKQPLWISNDSTGTQIVIPIDGGLIELFRSKRVMVDQRMIETLITQLGIYVDHGSPKKVSRTHTYHHIVPKLEPLFPVPQPHTHLETRGLSGDGKGNIKGKQKIGKELYQSKNLETERNRRKRIKDGLYALRALVPRISKMDRASIVGDAIEYIKDLQKNVQELQDELKELEEQDCMVNDGEVEVCKPKRSHKSSSQMPSNPHTCALNVAEMKPEVEVHQLGSREFLLKLICSHKHRGFLKIMETMNSLGLQVIDVNVTTCNRHVLNILNVKAKGKEIAAKNLKDLLLTSLSSQNWIKTP